MLSPNPFSQDLFFFNITLSANVMNAIWADFVSYGVIGLAFYGLVQCFHIFKGRGLQKNLDPLSLVFVVVPMAVFHDEAGTFLFSKS